MMRKSFITVTLFVLCLFSQPLLANTITTQADRTRLYLDESFQLIFTIKERASGINPDLQPLEKDFVVLGSSKSTQLSVINGQGSTFTKWIVNLSPKRTGELTIPVLNFGRFESQPIKVQVLTSSTANKDKENAAVKPVFLELTLEPAKPYENQQVILSAKMFYSARIINGSLTAPEVNDALLIPFETDKTTQIERDNRLYQVLEKRYAVFPQKSGPLTVNPMELSGMMELTGSQLGSLDPFNRGFVKPLRISSNSKTITVKPIPKQQSISTWFPAKNVTVSESWSSELSQAKVGDPITRTLVIEAKGLPTELFPELTPPKVAGANVYPDKAKDTNRESGKDIKGQRILKTVYIPTQAGELTLPEWKINWWDTNKQQSKTITLAKKTINIAGGKQQTTTNTNSNPPTTTPVQTATQAPTIKSNQMTSWIAAAVFALLWLATLLIKFNRKEHVTDQVAPEQTSTITNIKPVLKSLQLACTNNNKRLASKALLAWGRLTWPNANVNNLGDIIKLAGQGRLADHIQLLESAQYSSQTKIWQGSGLWQAVNQFKPTTKTVADNEDILPSLYK